MYLLSLLFATLLQAAPAAYVVLTDPQDAHSLTHFVKNDPNDEPYTVQTTILGVPCRYIPATKYGYFMADDNVVPSTAHDIIFRVTYLDLGTGELRLQYNATNSNNYQSAVVNKTNTGTWMTATMAVTDASFRNAQNQHADFRINENNYIARIELSFGTLDPINEPVTQPLGGSTYSEFRGKAVAGYQAWFKTAGQKDFWHHWGNDAIAPDGTRWPRLDNATFEIYPDVSPYADSALAQTGFANLGSGEPAQLYRSADQSVIDAHFALMQQAGLDGVAVQRFLGPSMRTITYSAVDPIERIRQAAEQNQRLFYICYDITSTGLESTWDDLIRFDWVYNVEQNYRLTQSPAYATINGKPVVQIWGTGFTDNHPGTAAETKALIQFLQSRGCYVIGGVPTYWRENRNDAKGPSQSNPANQESFEQVYLQYDMVSPWLVGRFSNDDEMKYFTQLQKDDKSYCNQHSIDYMPVLFPGFGWATWNTGVPNQAPRRAGDFLWNQAKAALSNGCQNLYFAMFDEYDEGTALAPAATDYLMLPTDAYFLTLSADGTWCSSDYYVRLAGVVTDSLHGSRTLAQSVTLPYSLGPVYYRNSFESRSVRYNYVNSVAQNQGIYPIDPCFYQPKELRTQAVTNRSCQIQQSSARTGAYSVALSLQASGDADYLYQFASVRIAITEPLQLSAYRQAVGLGQYATVAVVLDDATVLYAEEAIEEGGYQSPSAAASFTGVALYLGEEYVGRTIVSLCFAYRHSATGAVQAVLDDVLLEKTTPRSSTALPGLIDYQDASCQYYDLLGRPVRHSTTALPAGIYLTPSRKLLLH